MSEWISVEDRLPEQDGYYLVNVLCELANGVYLAKFENGATFMWHPFSKADVTHWMPLPEPPEVD